MTKYLLLLVILLAGCEVRHGYNDYLPSGGGVEAKSLDINDHTFLRIRWYAPSGQTYVGNWRVGLDEYNKYNVSDWWGDSKPHLVLCDRAIASDQEEAIMNVVGPTFGGTLFMSILYFAVIRRWWKRRKNRLPRVKVAND